MPSPYFSAIELERKLREERKEKDAKELEAKAAEVEKLAKKKAGGGALDEKEARRLEAFAKIVKGERAAAAAVAAGDRKGFKGGAGSATGSRLSSSVMCVLRALGARRLPSGSCAHPPGITHPPPSPPPSLRRRFNNVNMRRAMSSMGLH